MLHESLLKKYFNKRLQTESLEHTLTGPFAGDGKDTHLFLGEYQPHPSPLLA